MGIQDRDYYRDGSNRFLDAWGRQGTTVWLIAVTCVVFLAQCIPGPPLASPLVEYGAYAPNAVLEGELWRLITPLFLHGNLLHLFFNMLVLYWAGSRIEALYGPREFLAFYLIGGVFAQSAYLLAQASGAGMATSIGASGAVTAVLVLFAFHFPHQRVLLFLVIPMPVWALVVLYVVVDSFGALGVGNRGIAYVVHLGGALFGLIYFQTGLRFTRAFAPAADTAGRRVRPRLRIVPQPDSHDTPEPVGAAVESQPRPKEAADDNLEAKVDRVLDKVSKHGQESLTSEEREILFKASEVYKKRRR